MAQVNLQTWTRLKRLELQRFNAVIANIAMMNLKHWPATGEGRAVKSSSEKMASLLEHTHATGNIRRTFDVLLQVVGILKTVSDNSFFAEFLGKQVTKNAYYPKKKTLQNIVDEQIFEIEEFIAENTPNLPASIPALPAPSVRLQGITPRQKIGPVQFEFVNGVLNISHSVAKAKERDQANAGRAKEALISSGDWIIENLRGSNCDPRVVQTIEQVQENLSSEQDIIQLGISNISCIAICETLDGEVSDLIIARIRAYSTGIGLYLGQFPDWIQFCENASGADFDVSDVENTYRSTRNLLNSLKNSSAIVDPEVPRLRTH